MKVIAGKLDAGGMRFGIVVARFNDVVAARLLEGAVDILVRHGADDADITVVWVPGSFEIPLAAQELAAAGNVDAVVCLGVVIRGETPHFDYVAGECARGLMEVQLATRVPIGFGVLTTNTLEQAQERAHPTRGDKGYAAATAALSVLEQL